MLIVLVNSFIVMLVVAVHYEFLHQMSRNLSKLQLPHRFRIVLGVFGSLVAHAIEVWMFALAYYLMLQTEGWGQLTGTFGDSPTLLDCAYFSFTVFTTLGFGDVIPSGYIRYLTGIESLTGLVLITWTASYLYLEMQRNWEEE